MQDYINSFAWVSRISDIIPKIENFNNIEVNHSNYKEIFSNLNDYITIDEVITNTDANSFLFDLIFASKTIPSHEFRVLIADRLTKNDVKNFELCETEENCDIREIRKEIFDGLMKFFEKSESELNDAIDLAFSVSEEAYNHNLHFLSFEKASEKALENFKKIIQDEENKDELTERFAAALDNFINLETFDGQNKNPFQNMSCKVDLLKILAFLAGDGENFLIQDFDRTEFSDIEIPEKSKSFPKFSLVDSKHKHHIKLFNGQKINSFWIPEQVFYLPDVSKKIFCMLFEHTVDHLQGKLKNFGFGFGVGGRLEVLFEYLDSKKLKTNKDIENFIRNTSYNEMYDEFGARCEEFKNRTIQEFNSKMKAAHSNQAKNFNNNMHLIFPHNNSFVLSHMSDSKPLKYAETWAKDFKKIESLSKKNDIFEQIALDLFDEEVS